MKGKNKQEADRLAEEQVSAPKSMPSQAIAAGDVDAEGD